MDDYLPLLQKADGSLTTLYGDMSNFDASLWAPIVEKVFAKRYGNYEHIVAGLPSEAIKALTGAPLIMYEHKDFDVDAMW